MSPDKTAARLFLWASFPSGECQVISSGPVCCHLPVFSLTCLERAFSGSFSAYQIDSFLTIRISQTPSFSIFYLRIYCIEVGRSQGARETGEPDRPASAFVNFL